MKSNKGCFLKHNHPFAETNLKENKLQNVEYAFTITPLSTPCIMRKCARCDSKRFVSSDKFRVNANKKIIDVWLIFKCGACDHTLNVSIVSRKPIACIDRTLLEGFFNNDQNLVWKYAFDPSFIEREHTIDWNIEFNIDLKNGDHNTLTLLTINNISEISQKNEDIDLLIESRFFLKIPIYAVLRRIFNVSRSSLEKMQDKHNLQLMTFERKPLTLKNMLWFGCKIKLLFM